MSTAGMVNKADSPTLKRSFSPDLAPNFSSPSKKFEPTFHRATASNSPPSPSSGRTYYPSQRNRRRGLVPRTQSTLERIPSMPVQTSSRSHTAPMPSFMSVFGEGTNNRGVPAYSDKNAAPMRNDVSLKRPSTSSAVLYNPNSSFGYHHHRGSTSTSASESTDSSPTTTISTMDGSSLTEPSPGPSPASPASKPSPSSFVPDLRSRAAVANEKAKSGSQETQFFELQRPTTPAKKPRNLKGLAVNTQGSLGLGRAVSTAALPLAAQKPEPSTSSAPSSPSFVKPPTPPRRRPTNLTLTLQTGGNGNLPTLCIPPTPSVKRPNTLRHFQSSPSLPLCSPAVAPTGGMQLPPPRSKPPPHGFAEVPLEDEEEEQEPNFDVPQSREEKPQAYPHGPICIYESGVWLYFEPTAEQAAKYDVVLNVASEVVNPFTASPETKTDSSLVSKVNPTTLNNQTLTQSSDRPFAGSGSVPVAAAENTADQQGSSPTTPKATPVFGNKVDLLYRSNTSSKPEYIHVPWEHNTDIVPDLYNLVRLIDDRVQQGKRVLVHCQCGVSRSASLIVAYGLYKNPGISVQEAYDAVKKRSKWIGPNMNLIMQLQEFRNGLLRANGHSQGYRGGIPRRLSPNPIASSSSNDRRSSPFDVDSSGSRTPQTAPLPPDYGPDPVPQRASTGNMLPISPGPTSAPSGLAWASPGFRRTWDSSQAPVEMPVEQPFVDPKGHVIPVVTIQHQRPSLERERSFDREEGWERHRQEHAEKGRSDSTATIRAVPNFSRQFSIRQDKDKEDDRHMDGVLESSESPTSEQVFAVSSNKAQQIDSAKQLPLRMNNQPAELTVQAPPRKSSLFERRQNKPESLAQPFTPRTTEFNLGSLKPAPVARDDSYGYTSPSLTTLTYEEQLKQERQNDSVISMSDRDVQRGSGSDDSEQDEIVASPRSVEFHMIPFPPTDESEDDFGMLSPTRFEFSKNVFDSFNTSTESNKLDDVRETAPKPQPHVHAILPPTSSSQPAQSQFQSFGFLTAKQPHTPPGSTKLNPFEYAPSEEPSPMASVRQHVDKTELPLSLQIGVAPRQDNDSHLSAAPTLQKKFSNPDMQSQIRLHALQRNIESQLPNHDRSHAADELAALMSPRATQFTQNPFHVTLDSALDTPPVHSGRNPEPKQEFLGTGLEPERSRGSSTPPLVGADPRSPPHTGVSPITRNIWDVL